ncbi:MAG TPA: CHRD domain-containing protein [Nitrososphaeraceae archaeon]|nr:CHRD domain-containing protein [Nitrososphaeraceae archaeon]
MKFPTIDKKSSGKKKEEEKKENVVDFAAILTGKEEVPEVDTLDTALATFQSDINKNNKDDDEQNGIKYSVKVTDTEKIKEVHIHTGKSHKKGDVVAELYKSEIPSGEVIGSLTTGKISPKDLKGSLQGKNTKELVRKIEKGEAYVDIMTEDKPKGKVRGKIKKLSPS